MLECVRDTDMMMPGETSREPCDMSATAVPGLGILIRKRNKF